MRDCNAQGSNRGYTSFKENIGTIVRTINPTTEVLDESGTYINRLVEHLKNMLGKTVADGT